MSSSPCLPQTIRQLGNDIEKMVMKIHSGQIVTNLYLKLQEILRRVSSSSPCHCLTCSPCKGTRSRGAVSCALSQHGGPRGSVGDVRWLVCAGAGVPASVPGPPVWDDCDVPR